MKSKHLLAIPFIALTSWACKPEISPNNPLPSIKSFSPGTASKGDTVTILGTSLSNAKIYLDNTEVIPLKITDQSLSFIVNTTKDVFSTLRVQTDRNEETFPQKLILNHTVTVNDLSTWLNSTTLIPGDILPKQKQLLITDFDGHGIREAFATTNFTEVLFNSEQPSEATSFIGRDQITSKAGDDYYVLKMNSDIINDIYWHGALFSDSDLTETNSTLTTGYAGFLNTKDSPITINETTDLKNIYVNVLMFNSPETQNKVQILLKNEAKNFPHSEKNLNQGNGWEWVSISLHNLGVRNSEDALSINEIRFQWFTAGLELESDTQVFNYLDHIIITQGEPFLGTVN